MLTAPAVAPGTLLLAFLGGTTSGAAPGFTPPAGWVNITDFAAGGHGRLDAHISVAGDPTTWTWAVASASNTEVLGAIVAYAVAAGPTSGSAHSAVAGNTLQAPSATAFVSTNIIVEAWMADTGGALASMALSASPNAPSVRVNSAAVGTGGLLIVDYMAGAIGATTGDTAQASPGTATIEWAITQGVS